MSIAPGARLGAYEILSPLGAGGMGEVYRARDTRLNRDVAIKVLPDLFAADADRLARFKREAQVLASLNHPHIAAIYGIEEGASGSALILELVEGPTLADRIAQGPIPVDEVLPIARQIGEALEAAHEHGVIHRDLKPANIKLTSDRKVKVLDFGLAKATEARRDQISQSPTLTSPAMSRGGVILGTAAYMSPEQARGKTVDKRTDIWGFGCVLYEMLAGRRAFEGDDISETMAAILRDEPRWDALPAAVPAAVMTLIRRCLEKDPGRRVADISTARFVFDEPALGASMPAARAVQTHRARRAWRRAAVAAMAIAGAALLGAFVARYAASSPIPRITRLAVVPPVNRPVVLDGITRNIAISPDGNRVAWVSGNGTMMVRALDSLTPIAIGGLGSPRHPAFSPDGEWIAFFDAQESIKKVPSSGGPPTSITRSVFGARGLTWVGDETIVFATVGGAGLMRVSAAGGEPQVLTRPNRAAGEIDHLWPETLPTGELLFTITRAGGSDQSHIALLDSAGSQRILLHGGSHAHFVAPAYIVYSTAGSIRAVRFDLKTLSIVGTPVSLVNDVGTTPHGAKDADVSTNGTLAYVPIGHVLAQRTLVWVDRQGREQPIAGAPARAYGYPRVSPDGSQIVVSSNDQDYDLWRWDGQTLQRTTFDPGQDTYPLWTPDGKSVMWGSQNDGAIYHRAIDRAGNVDKITSDVNIRYPSAISPDGTRLVVRVDNLSDSGTDLFVLTLAGERTTAPLIATPFSERNADISPDGRWVAYESNEAGQYEVYVRPFPNVDDGKWLVSNGGGTSPLWARRSAALFFRRTDGSIMSASVNAAGTSFRTGPAVKVADAYYTGAGAFVGRTFDVSPDDSRFLVIKDSSSSVQPAIVVVQNWLEELKARVAIR
jgi:WD40 repeat protein